MGPVVPIYFIIEKVISNVETPFPFHPIII